MADTNTLFKEAEQLKAEGKDQEAIAKLEEVLAEDDTHVLAHSTIAVLHQKLGQHEKAIEHQQRVCELEPNDPFNFTALSVIYQRAYAGTGEHRYIQMAEDAMARSRTMQGGM